MDLLEQVASEDVAGLRSAWASYGNSWKSRGGPNAWFMLCRKFDRLENRLREYNWDIFRAIAEDDRREGAIDDVDDLRAYLLLVSAEMKARGFVKKRPTKEEKGGTPMPKKAPTKKPVAKSSAAKPNKPGKPVKQPKLAS